MPTGSLATTACRPLQFARWSKVAKSFCAVAAAGGATAYPTGHDLDEMATFSGTIRARFRTAALYDQAKAKTPFAMELLWQRTSVRSFSLQAPVVRFDPIGLPVTGPGRIEQSFNFRAEQSSSAAMLSAVLKNATAAGSYA
jgi:hypothetical protein